MACRFMQGAYLYQSLYANITPNMVSEMTLYYRRWLKQQHFTAKQQAVISA
ncbi:MAG: hypothetical protein IJ362_05065 [Oscillospiraceae bacterium]|nr:hypothetical protein [Oscillospiraceae bacterium]